MVEVVEGEEPTRHDGVEHGEYRQGGCDEAEAVAEGDEVVVEPVVGVGQLVELELVPERSASDEAVACERAGELGPCVVPPPQGRVVDQEGQGEQEGRQRDAPKDTNQGASLRGHDFLPGFMGKLEYHFIIIIAICQ